MSEREEPPPAGEETHLRRRMLDAAQRLVEQAGGLSVHLGNLPLDRVIKEAGVARTSVYREWDNKEAFYLDLLSDLAGPGWQGTAAFDEETIKLARNVVADRLDQLQTPGGRRRVLEEAVRQGARQNFGAVVASTAWRSYVTLTATLLSSPEETRRRIQESLQAAEQVFLERMSDFYADMTVILGLRLRSHVKSFQTLAAVGASVVEGLGLRQMLIPDVVNAPVLVEGPDGPEEWHLAALGFLGILDALVEPDPAYNYPEALATYLKRLAEREAAA